MNRNIRVISLSLLLALVLSVFGIFASFAEEATAPAVEYGKLMFDFDATQNKNLSNSTGASLIKKEAADGSPYWSYSIPGKDSTLGTGNGDYLEFSSWKEYINISTGVDENGNPLTDPNKQKNTDFLVIDFDISTDTTFIDSMYFHTAFYDDAYAHSTRQQFNAIYFDFDGAYGDTLSIGTNSNSTETYAYNTTSGDKWTDVTFVYDFRTENKVTVYIYMNGIYAGKTKEVSLVATDKQKVTHYARRFYFIRLTTPTQSQTDTNTNFANFTVKRFGVGYDGPLTDTNFGLGKTGATLDTMPDLAYCLEDKPEENLKKLATVTHSNGDSYDAYEFDELDANLVDGDVVTLYKNVAYPLIVPQGANITFKDEAGNTLTPGTRNSGDLVGLVELCPLDYSAGPFVTRDRKTMKTITQLTETNFATAFDVKNKGSVIYTLLADTEATFKNEGAAGYYPIIDLNGHTLTLGASSRAFLATIDNFVRIANGKFIFVGGGSDFTSLTKGGALIFENLDLFLTKTAGATFIDQRGGTVVFKDIKSIEREPILSSKKYVGATLSSAKSTYYYNSRVIVDNCTLNTEADASLVPAGKTVTSSAIFSTSNLASGGIRYAGQNVKFTFTDVVANLGKDSLLELNANTHTQGTPTTFKNDETKKHELVDFAPDETSTANNIHNTEIVFSNVEATTTNHLIGSALIRYDRNTGDVKDGNVTYKSVTYEVLNTKMNVNVDVDLDNCDISAKSLLYCTNGITFYDPAVNTDYDYSCDYKVDITGETNLDMSSDIIVNESTSRGYETLDIKLDGEILLPESFTNKDSRFTYSVAAPALLVSRNEGYAVTADKVQSYPYILGDHEYEFYWFAGETVSVDKIPVELPASSKYFSYSWAGPNDDGAYYAVVNDTIPVKANVSLYSDFILNIYLPTDLGTDCYKSLTLDGADTQVTLVAVDGVEYMKVSVADINPATAADATELAFKVEDGSLEATIVKSISVVDYLESALNNATSDTEAKLIVSMINYVDKAYQYVTPDGEELPESLTSLTSSAKYTAYTIDKLTDMTATKTVADLGVFEEVSISLNNAFRFTFKTKADFEGNLVFSYVKNGRLFVETKRCVGEREITLELKANELLQNITVSYGDTVGEYNLAAYLEWTKTTENAELVSLVEALWLYADYAKAYVAAVNP